MDIETLTSHISGLGKVYFEKVCKIVLQDVFNLRVINVDGTGDGGTDFSSYTPDGSNINAGYQITTQRSDIKNKAYKDAKKSLEKLRIKRFYFLTTYNLEEVDVKKLENTISTELDIQAICLCARHIAGLLLSENLVNKFLDETNLPLPRDYSSKNYDYKEMALHSYTLISDDASNLKSGIYDDSILFVLSTEGKLSPNDLLEKVSKFLGLDEAKYNFLDKRVGALFGKNKIQKDIDGNIELDPKMKSELESRKKIYDVELETLIAAQVDLLRSEFNTDWTREDSQKIAIWIANAFITEQIAKFKEVKASIVSNPLFKVEENGIDKIKYYLEKTKKIPKTKVNDAIEKLLENASSHPLITKLTRASVYLALEGANPISSAKALGANRWSDFNLIIEPSVAIPYICSQLFNSHLNKHFAISIKAIDRMKKLDVRLYIPFFYVKECAGHLLQARKYDNLNLNEEELQYSRNAFVANYYSLKVQNQKLPSTFMDYLAQYSNAIKTERSDKKTWTRAIMTDIQSILGKANVEFIDTPYYTEDDCKEISSEYYYSLVDLGIQKSDYLFRNDVYALQFTNDRILKENEHWIMLTYDKSLIAFGKNDTYHGWITSPLKFLDITDISRPLSETQLVSLVHTVATYSEKTLSAGARIIDKIIMFASQEMQNWEFKEEINNFKRDLINSINLENSDLYSEVDMKTENFLKQKGIAFNLEEEEVE